MSGEDQFVNCNADVMVMVVKETLCQTIWNWSGEEEEEEVVVMMVMRRDHQRPLSTAMKLMI